MFDLEIQQKTCHRHKSLILPSDIVMPPEMITTIIIIIGFMMV